jgi:hypothetical protein
VTTSCSTSPNLLLLVCITTAVNVYKFLTKCGIRLSFHQPNQSAVPILGDRETPRGAVGAHPVRNERALVRRWYTPRPFEGSGGWDKCTPVMVGLRCAQADTFPATSINLLRCSKDGMRRNYAYTRGGRYIISLPPVNQVRRPYPILNSIDVCSDQGITPATPG